MLREIGQVEDPDATVNEWLASGRTEGGSAICFSWEQERKWLPDNNPIVLDAIVGIEPGESSWPYCLISDEPGRFRDVTNARLESHQDVLNLCMRAGLTPIHLGSPVPLYPVTVPKPWGKEIWFTGIEARGISRAGSTLLPYLRSVAPSLVDGTAAKAPAPILLKVLAPHADPDFGELYFEAHREKTEVYVVTHIDAGAWPVGQGQIRLGFNTSKVRELGEDQFRHQYLAAAQDYRQLREVADEEFGAQRRQLGLARDVVVDLSTARAWQKGLPADTRRALADSRKVLDAFSNFVPLEVGDVVQVKPGIPHALQHGVNVVEFQTPHYERAILSFSQQVLTQDRWDTEEALEFVSFSQPPGPDIRLEHNQDGVRIENVANFDDFRVLRLNIEPGARHIVDVSTYSVIIGLRGELNRGSISADRAFYLPACAAHEITNDTRDPAACLVALPYR